MNTIVIDCGASFVKAAKFVNGEITERFYENTPSVGSENTLFDPAYISALWNVVYHAIEKLSIGEKEVKLCVSNEMHGFLLADANGVPFTDYISWQREIGKEELSILSDSEISNIILNCGMSLRAGLPICNLFYLSSHGYIEGKNSTLYFYTLGDFLIKKFTGKEPACHPTNAAATGLYSIIDKSWSDILIDYIGCSNIIFPVVSEKIISIKREGVLYHVLPAIGDHQAALLGAGMNKKAISFNLGTGAQVSVMCDKIQLSEEYQICPFFGEKYIKRIPHLPSGRALNVYFRFFREISNLLNIDISDEQLWEKLLGEAKGNITQELSFNMSFFENPMTEETVGSIGNISEFGFTVGNIINGAIKGMIKNYTWAANKLCKTNRGINTIIFSGGIASKISLIREEIVKTFPMVSNVIIAHDETLKGLYRYGESDYE